MKHFAAVVVLVLLAALSFFMYPAPDTDVPTPPNIGKSVATAQPSGIGDFSGPVGVDVVETTREVQAYLFHLDTSNKRVYTPSSVIPAHTLVKLGTCAGGYAQAEYQTKDNYWRVEYVKCQ